MTVRNSLTCILSRTQYTVS